MHENKKGSIQGKVKDTTGKVRGELREVAGDAKEHQGDVTQQSLLVRFVISSVRYYFGFFGNDQRCISGAYCCRKLDVNSAKSAPRQDRSIRSLESSIGLDFGAEKREKPKQLKI